ncbi:MAG: hypothetical protein MZV63_46795 [Marinilabiliales bacterium]|nr:hypothetical protein [Marinilabiliales bacterium]
MAFATSGKVSFEGDPAGRGGGEGFITVAGGNGVGKGSEDTVAFFVKPVKARFWKTKNIGKRRLLGAGRPR